MWSKLEDRYAHFIQPQEKDALIVELSKDEDRLYSEGENVICSCHPSGGSQPGDPITTRWREAEE